METEEMRETAAAAEAAVPAGPAGEAEAGSAGLAEISQAEAADQASGAGFDFSQVEKNLKDETALKNAPWEELLQKYEPWLVKGYAAHREECTPQQRLQWKEAINKCHQKMQKRTRIFMILFAVLTVAILAEAAIVQQLSLLIRGLMVVLAVYCAMNAWSHWLLTRKYSQIE